MSESNEKLRDQVVSYTIYPTVGSTEGTAEFKRLQALLQEGFRVAHIQQTAAGQNVMVTVFLTLTSATRWVSEKKEQSRS